ncbi:MAG TPA: sugar ABC transporter permease [Candidatus Elarobacter sp.]|nr:sugar ABC transporter permease [Candidatus Elarobacter sp.]HEV2737518.1 sugar ABC transporter permease [Candidatus Elarobacter sp.]
MIARSRFLARLDSPRVLGYLLIVPAALILLGLLAYPLVLGIWMSLTSATLGKPGVFVGLQNYATILADPIFRGAAAFSVFYTVCAELGKLTLGLALALILNQKFRGYRAARSLMLLPWVAPTVLSALAWLWLLDPQQSALSWLLIKMHLRSEMVDFLGHPWSARFSLIVVNIWRGLPYFAIGYLAGLQSISKDLYEAAAIDGASGWQAFRRITWPLLMPITTILVAFSSIFTLTDFQLIWTITKGGPTDATQVFTTLAYQRAISGGQLGEGAAIAISPIVFMIVLAFFVVRAVRER